MSAPPPTSTPAPNVVQLPLPPGMTLQQFQSLQGSLVTVAITNAVGLALLLWEYFNLLPNEIKVYQTSTKELWRTPASYAFVILRYAGIIAALPSLFFTSIQSNHCQAAVAISQVGAVLVVGASGIIFCYRVFAISGGSNFVYSIVGVMYFVMLASWIAVASQYRVKQGPPTAFGSNCQIQPVVPWAPICNAASVVFDLLILILTISRLGTQRESRVGYVIYRDSLIYFLLTTVTNLAVLAIQALGASRALIKASALPFSTVMTSTMGVRVFLNLRLVNQQDAKRGINEISSGTHNGRPFSKSNTSIPTRLNIPMQTIVVASEGRTGQAPEGPFNYSRASVDVKDYP